MDEELKNNDENAPEEENKSGISADLIRGHINTIILRTLYERDKYGYEIIEEIEAKSHGQYSLKQPTLYSALKRLESQGYITAYWKTDEVSNGGRRKYYKLTDNGREITEKNQSEWEYSRTVIDSLISDRNFDFTQPAPTPVDFKILKSSTSRVPHLKDDSEREVKYDEGRIDVKEYEQKPAPLPEPVAVQEPQPQPIVQEAPQPVAQEVQPPVQQIVVEQPVQQEAMEQPVQQIVVEQPVQQPAPPVQQLVVEQPIQQEASEQPVQQSVQPVMSREQRLLEERRIHENYLRLISEPVAVADETPTNPYSENINTDKLIYNKKPETERDYKNLIDNLFVRTVKQRQPEKPVQAQKAPPQVHYSDATEKASSDGLTVNTTDYSATARRKKYNRGAALFKSSLIIAVIMLVEFALTLAFKEQLNIGISYPIVIVTLAVAQLLIFGVLTTTDFGKSTRKPANLSYVTTTIVLAIISILIIFVCSLLLNVNFASVGDVLAKIIIPSVVALNMPIFSAIFYTFSK